MNTPRRGMVETRQGKRRAIRSAKEAYSATDSHVKSPAHSASSAKNSKTVNLGYNRFVERVRRKGGKVVIATVPDPSTQERLAELERQVGLITRFGSKVDYLKAIDFEAAAITPPDILKVLFGYPVAHSTTAAKLDGPLDLSRVTLPAVDPETFSEQSREAIQQRFQSRKKEKA
ncbi:hypothetical protein [Burkholderia vietnamiensis]|uniref:hypothetical protein n=1 Tax=Burkholderia vietnamiensis TaxID=60552 RepID=UPI001B94096B|nr:hypothetical protein [Burkholderia vietnamiensis]MBR8284398.1 hypothetical protein [Burkholderia vietnamiensis]